MVLSFPVRGNSRLLELKLMTTTAFPAAKERNPIRTMACVGMIAVHIVILTILTMLPL
jgi:hypothetical protein